MIRAGPGSHWSGWFTPIDNETTEIEAASTRGLLLPSQTAYMCVAWYTNNQRVVAWQPMINTQQHSIHIMLCSRSLALCTCSCCLPPQASLYHCGTLNRHQQAPGLACMAVLHLTQHLVSEHHQHLLNVHRPASSAVHHHVVHPGLLLKPSTSPPSSSSSSLLLQQHEQRRHLVCSASSGQHGESACAGGICATSHHQQHQQQQLQQQQHRGSNSSCGAGASRATLGATAPQQQPASLGWNTASVFFSKFTLGEQMGAGSFGTVHRAVHMQTGASYAVKVLPKHCGARGMQLDAIRREVNTWSQAMGSKYVAKLEGLFEVRLCVELLCGVDHWEFRVLS